MAATPRGSDVSKQDVADVEMAEAGSFFIDSWKQIAAESI